MPQSKLPEAFEKRYFSHLCTKIQNQNYVKSITSVNCEFTESERQKNNYIVTINYIFNFKGEIINYSISDFHILTQAFLKFRELMLQEGDVGPFSGSMLLNIPSKLFQIWYD